MLDVVAIAGIPVLLAADVALALARGWWTTNSMPLALGVFAAVAVATVALLLATRARRAAFARRAPALALLAGALVVAWLTAEVAVQALLGDKLWFHRRAPHTRATFHPTPEVMPGVSGPAAYTANSLGLRGPEWPAREAARRVLCVGGSTTACLFLDDSETWPALLQRRLAARAPTWVGDAGKSGYGTWHHLRFLEDEELLRQVDTLVVLVGINDFMRALQGRRIAAAFGVHPLYERSRIFTVLHNAYQTRKEQRQDREEFGSGEGYVVRRARRARAPKRADLPDLAGALAEYRQNLAAMVRAARHCGVEPVFATQPVLWTTAAPADAERLLWLGELPDGSYLATPALAVGMQAFNDALRETCAAHGVRCIDLGSMDGEPAFFFDDCHFTEAGAAKVAELIAAGLDGP